jgi:hypothetical protein
MPKSATETGLCGILSPSPGGLIPLRFVLVHHLLQRYRVSHRLCHWTEKPRRNTESKMSVLEPCPVRTPGGALVSEGTYSLVGSSRCSRVSFLGQGCNARLPP